MDIYVCMAESPCCPPETITALLIGYTPIQNKKLKTIFSHPDKDAVVVITHCSINLHFYE